MTNNKLLSISLILLALSILFGSIYMGNSLKQLNLQPREVETLANENGLISAEDAAKYLNISIYDFTDMLWEQEKEKMTLSSYTTHRFIHYIEVNGDKLFSKVSLDKWIEHNLYNK